MGLELVEAGPLVEQEGAHAHAESLPFLGVRVLPSPFPVAHEDMRAGGNGKRCPQNAMVSPQ